MRPALVRLFAQQCQSARSFMLQTGQLRPMFLLFTHDNRMVPVIAGGGSRDDAYAALRIIATAHDAEAVIAISEAWMVPADYAREMLRQDMTPSESDRRIEVLALQLVTRDDARVAMFPIKRDDAGRCTGFRPNLVPRDQEGGEAGGAIARILPKERPTQAERAAAHLAIKLRTGQGGTVH